MTILQILLAAKNEPRFGEDGESIELELLPPANSSEIEQLELQVGGTLEDELRDLLATTRGFTGPVPIDVLDLVTGDFAIECDFLFPRMHPIASDGTGNFWIVDLTRPAPSLGPVFDLRNAVPGTGFPWGRFGSRPESKRHDRLPIFAFRSRTGFLRRLFR